jgi:hypothetical protein
MTSPEFSEAEPDPRPWNRGTTSRWPRDAGRTAEAITLAGKTLADRERLLGTGHPDTKSVRDNLASLTT